MAGGIHKCYATPFLFNIMANLLAVLRAENSFTTLVLRRTTG